MRFKKPVFSIEPAIDYEASLAARARIAGWLKEEYNATMRQEYLNGLYAVAYTGFGLILIGVIFFVVAGQTVVNTVSWSPYVAIGVVCVMGFVASLVSYIAGSRIITERKKRIDRYFWGPQNEVRTRV